MSLEHLRTRRRLALLASDALEGHERGRALAHVAACPRCAAELQQLRGALELVLLDPARAAEPPLETGALVRLTQARIDRLASPAAPERGRPFRLWVPLAAAAALAVIASSTRLVRPVVEPPRAQPAQEAFLSEESLRRLTRTVDREQAARYLDQAEAVLVSVAAAPQHCDRTRKTVDLSEERKRSRELLTRRALLVDLDSEEIRSVRPVLEDVERVLRQVATLDACAKPEDLLAIHEELRDRRLLMKIDLMTRELLG